MRARERKLMFWNAVIKTINGGWARGRSLKSLKTNLHAKPCCEPLQGKPCCEKRCKQPPIPHRAAPRAAPLTCPSAAPPLLLPTSSSSSSSSSSCLQ